MFLLVKMVFEDAHWVIERPLAVYSFATDAEAECNRLAEENTDRDVDYDVWSVEQR